MIGSKHVQNRFALNLFFCFILAGCASPRYIAAKCPAPVIPPEPHYPFYDLTDADASKYGKVTKSCVVSLKMCEGYAGHQQRILEGYKND